MPVEIINSPFSVELYGCPGVARNRDYAATGSTLMDAMWKEVRSKQIKNKGINYWVYEAGESLFAGVELEGEPPPDTILIKKKITLPSYAYWKHIGPYSELKSAYNGMHSELEAKKISSYFPFLEIYGHWTPDESKLETEILFSLNKQ